MPASTQQIDDPQARDVVEMARQLGIDPTTEFHLLPIAQHALESPVEILPEEPETDEKQNENEEGPAPVTSSSDLPWFRSLVDNERKRFAGTETGSEQNPWLKLTNPNGRAYWYNFETHRKSARPPTVRNDNEHVQSGDPGLGVMRFTSWWNENGTRRYIHIAYFLESEEFEVKLDVDPNTYRIKTLRGKYGPATCWDLHIGATLTIFGKPTTLRQCDSETRRWIQSNSKRLFRLKKGLEAKLIKYEPLPRTNFVSTANLPPAQVHLRQLVKAVAFLKNRLAVYRPTVAEMFKI